MLGSGVKIRVGRETGNKGIFLFGLRIPFKHILAKRSREPILWSFVRRPSLSFIFSTSLQVTLTSLFSGKSEQKVANSAEIHNIRPHTFYLQTL